MKTGPSIAALFAGIGGIEEGLRAAGGHTKLTCEVWEPAQAVLAARFPGAEHVQDIRDLDALPEVDLVTAGFPCTDLSQAGRTAGIGGAASGLVSNVFRLLKHQRMPLLLLENVRNMLVLDRGEAMRYLTTELEVLGYRWAYRLVDSRFTGVPQRRQRVIFVASLDLDPCTILFADESGEPAEFEAEAKPCGFYWTEGRRGLGWAVDAVPTLKGGSGLGIPSPPAIWNPEAELGRRLVTVSIEEAEQLQGFPPGWTEPAEQISSRKGTRWKLVGNAVTTGVARWVGMRISDPGHALVPTELLTSQSKWPKSACGENGSIWKVDASMWPIHQKRIGLGKVVDLAAAPPLSGRATSGFLSRAEESTLRFKEGFLRDVAEHNAFMEDLRAA